MVEMFDDRIDITNFGGLAKGLKPEDFGKKSILRNPIIAKIFRFVRLAENIGSGFHKMIYGWKQHYKIEPVIEGDFDYYKITFPTTQKKLGVKLGVKLGENELKILKLMEDNKYITTKELSEHIKISTTAIDNNISKLKEKGILERIGPAKGGHWKIK